MKKIALYLINYAVWIIDLLLGVWVIYLARTTILDILALHYKPGMWEYEQLVTLLDKVFLLVLGLAWLAFMIFAEEYIRAGIRKGNMAIRIARLNGPIFLVIFCIDLTLFWLQGISSESWLRWLILAGELGFGMVFIMYYKNKQKTRTN